MNRKAYYNTPTFGIGNIVFEGASLSQHATYGVVLDSDNSFGHAPSYRVLWQDGSVSHRMDPWDLERLSTTSESRLDAKLREEFEKAIQCEALNECIIHSWPKLNHEDLLDFRLGRKL